MTHRAGRHFLQIPGPRPVPDRVLRAISAQGIDHRGPDFVAVGTAALEGMKGIFKTRQDVIIYPSSGTGAWEGALVSVLSEGDRVLMYETGHFAAMWRKMAGQARKHGAVAVATGGERRGADIGYGRVRGQADLAPLASALHPVLAGMSRARKRSRGAVEKGPFL